MSFCQWQFSDSGPTVCVHCGEPVAARSRTVRRLCPVGGPSRMVVVPTVQPAGPGTELKRLLAGWPFYITPQAGCRCEEYAAQMDAWGPDECDSRLDEIVGWLRAEAGRRGLPFMDAAGRLLVRRAIHNARATTPPPADSGAIAPKSG